jgi:hypothetical protein
MTGLSEHDVRTGQSFLFAGIVELASALGFAIVGLAIGPKPSPGCGPHQTMKAPTEATLPEPSPVTEAGLNLHVASKPVPRSSRSVSRATTLMVRRSVKDPERSKDVEAFLQARTQSTEGGRVGSTNLHAAFNEYCRSHSLPERSQQALGKELSRLRLAKERCSRTGRVEYCGLALCGEHSAEPILNGSSRTQESHRHLIITKSTGKSNACH